MYEQILQKLNEVLKTQDEMKAMILTVTINPAMKEPELWLTKAQVMDLLCVSERTFYRLWRAGDWVDWKCGGTWRYLKSSLRRE